MDKLYDNVKMVEVKSSNIKSVGYFDGDLYTQYTTGLYVYKGVPQEVYESLLNAESKGRFMNENIKNKYNYDYLR